MKPHELPHTHFGASVPRVEDAPLLTGQARFVDDMAPPGLLHAAFVRSPLAHARIRGIDTSAAQSARGVVRIVTFADLPAHLQKRTMPLLVPNPAITQVQTQYTLPPEEVRYVGEPVAMVIATSRALAEDACALVDVDYEALPAVANLKQALAPDGPRAHLGSDTNVAGRTTFADGDVDAAFAGAAHRFRATFHQHRGGGFAMETRTCLAVPDTCQQGVVAYIATQSPHRTKRNLLDMLGLSDSQLRVVAPDVGGGFGPKGSFYPEYTLLVLSAMQLNKPVKWVEDRREHFLCTHQERDQIWDLEIAVDADARIRGLRGRLTNDCGAYVPWGLVLPWIAVTTLHGPYVIPAFSIELLAVFTNRIMCTPVRGAGRPQAVFSMERLMDIVAAEMKLDRAEVRRRNFIQPAQMPWSCRMISRDGKPVVYDSGDYPEAQRRALEIAGYADFDARRKKAREAGRYIGIGMANFVEGTGLGPYEGAALKITNTGAVVLYTGAAPHGQSHKTTLAQIAADQLGIAPQQIEVVTGDTAGISLGMGTFAARSAVNAGNAVHLAAVEVRRRALLIGAQMLQTDPAKLTMKDGGVYDTTDPTRRLDFRQLSFYGTGMPGYSLPEGIDSPGLEHTAYFSPSASTYSNGCHVVEAEVDVETGHVTLLRYVVLDDCGRAINPMVVHGQVVGGVVHGIGNALLEQMVYDDSGQPVSTNFGEYLMPTAAGLPPIEVHHMETPSPLNPLGVKGAGEGGTLPAAAAIISAIEHALSPFGVRIHEAPITPMRIVELLAQGRP
ncbi:xanthine dehydrogenase family protein molybdopterin-binding subunit [Ramlibacter sp.]|uniref:xanthine dehydrogenase family protein molybdopterin-binding subunit n=1 Tax=Ramlibacter sp. TaxID=1917967 RepID=UPI003D144F42